MTRLLMLAGWLLIGGLLAAFVYAVAEDVERQEAALEEIEREILKEQRALHILKAEWSYLIQPSRIQDLIERHQGRFELVPVSPEQIGTFADLPMRRSAVPAEMPDGAATLPAGETAGRDPARIASGSRP